IHTFAEMVALAQSKGGRCLSAPSDFVDTKSVLRFTCAAGHEWTTRVTNLVHRGRWCPECGAAHSPALTLTDIQDLPLEAVKSVYRRAIDAKASDAEGAAWWAAVAAGVGAVSSPHSIMGN
ncbi:hypothetical protein PO002_45700, partial [Cupriavidus necator]